MVPGFEIISDRKATKPAKKIPSGGGVARGRGGFSNDWKNLYRRRACRPARQSAKNLLFHGRFEKLKMTK